MKRSMVLLVLVGICGLANAELTNMDFEEGMSGWGTWGSGSGSGPSGYMWTSHWAYIDSTGNGVADSNNFMNLTTSSQIGYYEYGGFGFNYAFRSSDYFVFADPGDWFEMGVWAKDVGGYGGRLELRFFWLRCENVYPGCGSCEPFGPIPPDRFYFDVTDEWVYYEATVQAPLCTAGLKPNWGNPDPGTEIGIDNVVFPHCHRVVDGGDLDDDCRVGLTDVVELASGWQTIYYMSDLANVAENWLIDCDVSHGAPACVFE